MATGELALSAVQAMEAEFIRQEGAIPSAVSWVDATQRPGEDAATWGEKVKAGLLQVSRLSNRSQLSQLGFGLDRLDEIVIWIVADLASPNSHELGRPADGKTASPASPDSHELGRLANEETAPPTGSNSHESSGDWLARLAVSVGELTAQTLNVTTAVTGMLLNDNSAAARETLRELDAQLEAENGFSQGCYLLGLLNQDSLALPDRAALARKAGLLLYLLTATPLRDMGEMAGYAPAFQPRYASLGVYQLSWESERVRAILAKRGAQAAVKAFLTEVEPGAIVPIQTRLENALRRLELAPGVLLDAVVPHGLRTQSPYSGVPFPWEMADFPARIRSEAEAWFKVLEHYRAENDIRVRALLREKGPGLAHVLEDEVPVSPAAGASRGAGSSSGRYPATTKPGMTPGCIAEAQLALTTVGTVLENWVVGLEEKLEEYQDALPSLETALREQDAKLSQLVSRFSALTPGNLFKLISRPWRLVSLYQLYRQIESASRQLWLRQGAMVENHLVRWAGEIALALYAQLQAQLAEGQMTLDAWREALADAQTALEQWEHTEPCRDEIWHDPSFLERLAAGGQLYPDGTDNPLTLSISVWDQPPTPTYLATRLFHLAEEPVNYLVETDALDALGQRLDKCWERGDWLRAGLVLACPLWQVDTTRLTDLDRGEIRELEVFLRPNSFSNADEELWPGTEQITHFPDNGPGNRLVIVRSRAGVPLNALLGM